MEECKNIIKFLSYWGDDYSDLVKASKQELENLIKERDKYKDALKNVIDSHARGDISYF